MSDLNLNICESPPSQSGWFRRGVAVLVRPTGSVSWVIRDESWLPCLWVSLSGVVVALAAFVQRMADHRPPYLTASLAAVAMSIIGALIAWKFVSRLLVLIFYGFGARLLPREVDAIVGWSLFSLVCILPFVFGAFFWAALHYHEMSTVELYADTVISKIATGVTVAELGSVVWFIIIAILALAKVGHSSVMKIALAVFLSLVVVAGPLVFTVLFFRLVN